MQGDGNVEDLIWSDGVFWLEAELEEEASREPVEVLCPLTTGSSSSSTDEPARLSTEQLLRESNEKAKKVHMKQSPELPSESEVAEHNATHLPYRSWCVHCVEATVVQQQLTLLAYSGVFLMTIQTGNQLLVTKKPLV